MPNLSASPVSHNDDLTRIQVEICFVGSEKNSVSECAIFASCPCSRCSSHTRMLCPVPSCPVANDAGPRLLVSQSEPKTPCAIWKCPLLISTRIQGGCGGGDSPVSKSYCGCCLPVWVGGAKPSTQTRQDGNLPSGGSSCPIPPSVSCFSPTPPLRTSC